MWNTDNNENKNTVSRETNDEILFISDFTGYRIIVSCETRFYRNYVLKEFHVKLRKGRAVEKKFLNVKVKIILFW